MDATFWFKEMSQNSIHFVFTQWCYIGSGCQRGDLFQPSFPGVPGACPKGDLGCCGSFQVSISPLQLRPTSSLLLRFWRSSGEAGQGEA